MIRSCACVVFLLAVVGYAGETNSPSPRKIPFVVTADALQHTGTPTAIRMTVKELPPERQRVMGDDLDLVGESTNCVPVASSRQIEILKDLSVWVRLVVSEEYAMDDSVGATVFVCDYAGPESANQGIDIFRVSYEKKGVKIIVLDTPATIDVIFRSTEIKRGTDETIASNWQTLIHRFMRQAGRYDHPDEIRCLKTMNALHLFPDYGSMSQSRGRGQECWWAGMGTAFKITDGFFRVTTFKCFDGEHPTAKDYGIGRRYEDYGKKIARMKTEEVLTEVSRAHEYELYEILSKFDPARVDMVLLLKKVLSRKGLYPKGSEASFCVKFLNRAPTDEVRLKLLHEFFSLYTSHSFSDPDESLRLISVHSIRQNPEYAAMFERAISLESDSKLQEQLKNILVKAQKEIMPRRTK